MDVEISEGQSIDYDHNKGKKVENQNSGFEEGQSSGHGALNIAYLLKQKVKGLKDPQMEVSKELMTIIESSRIANEYISVEPRKRVEITKFLPQDMQIRKEALWACFAMEPNFEAMISDVCVPLSHLAELISRSKKELDASPLVCTVIAHAGDGNFHTVILFNPSQEEQQREAERLNQFMVYTALSMEGTCTGEHGVGTGKMKYLEKELGIEALRTMKSIKQALDTNNIMNPGKLIPPHVCL